MATTERLVDFPVKATPVLADILYCGDSADSFNEVQITIASMFNIYPALVSIGGLTTAADQMIYATASNTYATAALTAFARTLLDDANAAAAAVTLAVLPLAGGTMSGALNMGSNLITNVTNPSSAQDAATKAYVDAAIQNLQSPCYASTTANLAGYTYANGTAGVGATLTAGSNGAFSTDGTSPAINSRIFVPFQSTTFQNGVYTLTTVGDGSNPAVLTRATDYDQAAEINAGDIFTILNGTIYAGAQFIETATVTTIGTDPITFTQIANNNYLLKSNNLSDVANTTTARTNIGAAASALTLTASGLVTGGGDLSANRSFTVTAADQSAMETDTSTTTAVVPGVMKYSPGVAKAWCNKVGNSTTINRSYNVSSTTHASTGTHVINFTTSFSDSAYVTVANSLIAATLQWCIPQSQATGSVSINTYNSGGTLTDPTQLLVACFGDF